MFSRNIMLCNGNGNAEVSCETRVGKSLPQRQSQRESKRESERERERELSCVAVFSGQ